MREYTEDFEINNTAFGRPHVVLLGAGASYAALPKGDKNGKKIPLLKDLVDTVNLKTLIQEVGIKPPYDDFEAIYSKIADNSDYDQIRQQIDNKVFKYFESLELPDEPTLYDHLVLSLRPKDVIATFNWDPFLWNACYRNKSFSDNPCVLFLHGSVAIARCDKCKIVASRSSHVCYKCGEKLIDIPILFPVTKKNYNSDPAIAGHWRTLKRDLKQAYIFTIFGYSAPKTDYEAIKIMQDGWGDSNNRELEEIEIIDIQDKNSLRESWDNFIHSHHYTIVNSFYESFAGRHPRRSCEALWSQSMECMFLKPYTISDKLNFDDLYDWLQPRIGVE